MNHGYLDFYIDERHNVFLKFCHKKQSIKYIYKDEDFITKGRL